MSPVQCKLYSDWLIVPIGPLSALSRTIKRNYHAPLNYQSRLSVPANTNNTNFGFFNPGY